MNKTKEKIVIIKNKLCIVTIKFQSSQTVVCGILSIKPQKMKMNAYESFLEYELQNDIQELTLSPKLFMSLPSCWKLIHMPSPSNIAPVFIPPTLRHSMSISRCTFLIDFFLSRVLARFVSRIASFISRIFYFPPQRIRLQSPIIISLSRLKSHFDRRTLQCIFFLGQHRTP